MAMASGTSKTTLEQAMDLVLGRGAAADGGVCDTMVARRMKCYDERSKGTRRGPALTSPIWRAWNPEAPENLDSFTDVATAADNPALTSPVRSVRRA